MCFPWCQLALPHAPGAPQRIPRSFAAPSLGQGCRASFAQPGWDSQACVFRGLVPSVILSRSLVVPHSGGDFHPRAVSEMKSCELQLWGAQLRSQPGRRIRGEKDPGGAQSPWRGSRRAGDGLRTGNGGTRHREWEHRTQGMAPSARELVGLVLPAWEEFTCQGNTQKYNTYILVPVVFLCPLPLHLNTPLAHADWCRQREHSSWKPVDAGASALSPEL